MFPLTVTYKATTFWAKNQRPEEFRVPSLVVPLLIETDAAWIMGK